MDGLTHARATVELHFVALSVVEADRFDMTVARQGPSQANGGILPAREDDQGGTGIEGHDLAQEMFYDFLSIAYARGKAPKLWGKRQQAPLI